MTRQITNKKCPSQNIQCTDIDIYLTKIFKIIITISKPQGYRRSVMAIAINRIGDFFCHAMDLIKKQSIKFVPKFNPTKRTDFPAKHPFIHYKRTIIP